MLEKLCFQPSRQVATEIICDKTNHIEVIKWCLIFLLICFISHYYFLHSSKTSRYIGTIFFENIIKRYRQWCRKYIVTDLVIGQLYKSYDGTIAQIPQCICPWSQRKPCWDKNGQNLRMHLSFISQYTILRHTYSHISAPAWCIVRYGASAL